MKAFGIFFGIFMLIVSVAPVVIVVVYFLRQKGILRDPERYDNRLSWFDSLWLNVQSWYFDLFFCHRASRSLTKFIKEHAPDFKYLFIYRAFEKESFSTNPVFRWVVVDKKGRKQNFRTSIIEPSEINVNDLRVDEDEKLTSAHISVSSKEMTPMMKLAQKIAKRFHGVMRPMRNPDGDCYGYYVAANMGLLESGHEKYYRKAFSDITTEEISNYIEKYEISVSEDSDRISRSYHPFSYRDYQQLDSMIVHVEYQTEEPDDDPGDDPDED